MVCYRIHSRWADLLGNCGWMLLRRFNGFWRWLCWCLFISPILLLCHPLMMIWGVGRLDWIILLLLQLNVRLNCEISYPIRSIFLYFYPTTLSLSTSYYYSPKYQLKTLHSDAPSNFPITSQYPSPTIYNFYHNSK